MKKKEIKILKFKGVKPYKELSPKNDKTYFSFRLIGYKNEEKIKIEYDEFFEYRKTVIKLFELEDICEEHKNIIEVFTRHDSPILTPFIKSEPIRAKHQKKFIRIVQLKSLALNIFGINLGFNFEKPKKLSKEEIIYVNYSTLYEHILLASIIILYKLDKILAIKLNDEICSSVLWTVTKALSDAYANHFDNLLSREIIIKEIFPIYNQRLGLLKILIDNKTFKHIPNRKYTSEMFNLVVEKMMEGKKQYVAIEDTLEELGIKDTDPDTFARSYRKYIRNK